MSHQPTRRRVVLSTVQIGLGGAFTLGLSSCGGEGGEPSQTVCADPETMSASEERMRASLGYTAQSPDPEEACADCTYFKGGEEEDGCGSCDLLMGAQVNGMGRCNSWSPRDA